MNSAQIQLKYERYVLHIVNDLPYWLMHREPIAAAALKVGFKIAVASADNAARNIVHDRGYEFIPLPIDRFNLGLIDIKFMISMRNMISMLRPDVVHLFTVKPLLFGGIVLRSISSRSRPLVLGTIAGLGRGFDLPALQKRLLILGLRNGLGKVASSLTFENPTDAMGYVDAGIASTAQVKVFKGAGIDLRTYRPNFGIKSDKLITFLFASRLLRSKGALVFAEAARRLKPIHGSRVRFLMAGIEAPEDPDSLSSNELFSIQNDPAIEWLGAVSSDQMPRIMQEADVFVLPTTYPEGLPRSCLEAGACGAAVIAGDVPGTRILIDNNVNGLLLPDTKLETLVSAMERMIEPYERINFGLALREKIETGGYSLNAITDQFLKLYSLNAYQ